MMLSCATRLALPAMQPLNGLAPSDVVLAAKHTSWLNAWDARGLSQPQWVPQHSAARSIQSRIPTCCKQRRVQEHDCDDRQAVGCGRVT